ncbi:baseplate J/gp47 family protein [Cellulomonas sp. ATA003]|uniref:baseplate J/gp47 family protein n=1 Tax=Cellulomonas sp. ATA003 TaxID=3073064 RepID=UPI0028735C46|nr:baseplate J/gp47 family protein [Cellulomonas sp. ATA003]WNB87304.1 baseplate J/gp47 family protein [Cellulomonas sp. ATA003]
MPLPVPNLDDRDFAQLLAEARAVIRARSPEWTDLSPGDPGATLLEAFAYLTDTLVYRVNRAPEKAYVQFLNLIGVRLEPPASASVVLTFSAGSPVTGETTIPRGTRVTAPRGGSGGPVFVTSADAVLRPGEREVDVLAHHGEAVAGELVGHGTGAPGQSVRVARAPITLPTGDDFDLVVAVESAPEELDARTPARRVGATTFRVWTEANHFGSVRAADEDDHLYVVDRSSGTVTFAPAARFAAPSGGLTDTPTTLATVPAAGRQIRVWYRVGGGASGNVAAGTLTTLKDPVGGMQVVNREAATGGRDGETLENAMVRGPQVMHALDRVVTARDYEHVAVASSGGVSRARAVTRAELWRGATPGEVEVLLVPHLDEGAVTAAGPDDIRALMTDQPVERVRAALEERQPMGTRVRVGWAGLKPVRVTAKVVVHRAEDRTAVAARLSDRLRRVLSPVPVAGGHGWPFGEELRVATMYEVLQSERGVRYVSDVRLVVEEMPGDVAAIVRDAHQPGTWFCASGERVYRSVNDGEGWEPVAEFPGERVERLSVLPGRPGLVVATTRVAETEASVVHASLENGDRWARFGAFEFHVEGVALGTVEGAPYAFLATDEGLYRQRLRVGAPSERILVAASDPSLACYSVACVPDPGGALRVAVALQEFGGVRVSFEGGQPGTFTPTGLTGVDVRVLRGLMSGNRSFVYAGAYATGDDDGVGIQRLELRGTEPDPQGWLRVGAGWQGGACLDIALMGETVVAATARSGVTVLGAPTPDSVWRVPAIDCGLPLRENGGFAPVVAVAVDTAPLALTGGPGGLFRSTDGRSWDLASDPVYIERVTLPPTWLFVGGTHDLDVTYDTARR